jgi:replicative DNA helicase
MSKDDEGLEEKVLVHRNINEKVQKFYGVTTSVDETGKEVRRVYPYPHRAKFRYLPKDFSKNPGFTGDHLFGMDKFNAGSSKFITVVEGEEDVLSAYQMLGEKYPVVGVPGASISRALLRNCHEYLDSFTHIVVAADNDEAGEAMANKLAATFPNKVYKVSLTKYNDPNEYLMNGEGADFKYAWFNRTKFTPDNILNAPEQFLDLYRETPDHQYVPTGISELDDKIMGIMQGHFTVLKAETGIGKSLAPDTKVLKYDGSVVRADGVKVGDQLMGPDSTPRNVTNVNLQDGEMYRITPVKGEPFECNADHILSLRHTSTGEVKNVVLTDYLKWSKTQKHLWKMWRTGVDFCEERFGTNSWKSAYVLGCYLGDGHKHGPAFSMGKKKAAVMERLYDYGVRPSSVTFDRGCYRIGFSKDSNTWRSVCNNLEPRSVPHPFKVGSRKVRLYTLAGLLDTDGSSTDGGAEITQKSEVLAEDICFLSRSLGFAAYKKTKVVEGVMYYRVTISGDLTEIPCVRLKFAPRKQVKSVLNTGFTVEHIGVGTYRGIMLDGDHLFLLGDFTVTHNTELFRKLQHKFLKEGVTIGSWHLEETKTRSLLGLVSYELKENLTRKDIIESKSKETEVEGAIVELTKDENLYQFYLSDGSTADDLITQIRYLVEACGVQYVFFEPIQDVLGGDEQLLSDLAIRLSKLAAELNVGIVTIAHTNEDGEIKYCKMIGQRASVIIELQREKDAVEEEVRNTTTLYVRKNRPCADLGYGGQLSFDPKTFTLKEKL